MKIGYRRLDGGTSTAYLDCDHNNQHFTCGHGADGPHVGADKYTDHPIAVAWNDQTREWVETGTPTPPCGAFAHFDPDKPCVLLAGHPWPKHRDEDHRDFTAPTPTTRSRTQQKRLTRAQRKGKR